MFLVFLVCCPDCKVMLHMSDSRDLIAHVLSAHYREASIFEIIAAFQVASRRAKIKKACRDAVKQVTNL